MKLKFRSTLAKNLSKWAYEPYETSNCEVKPIDLSLKSRLKNFIINKNFKKSTNGLKTNSPVNSQEINSNSNQKNNLVTTIPPSPPNSIEEDEDDYLQKKIYYNQLINNQSKSFNDVQNYSTPINSYLKTSQINQNMNNNDELNNVDQYSNYFSNQFDISPKHLNSKTNDFYNQLSKCNLDDINKTNHSLYSIIDKTSLNQLNKNENVSNNQYFHFQKQMIKKHASQSSKTRLRNQFPYNFNIRKKKLASDEDEDEETYSDENEDSFNYNYKKQYNLDSSKKTKNNFYGSSAFLYNSFQLEKPLNFSNDQQFSSNDKYNNYFDKNIQPSFLYKSNNENNKSINNFSSINITPNNSTENLAPTDSSGIDLDSLQNFYKEYYKYLLNQPNATGKLTALQIIMKNLLKQNNEILLKEKSVYDYNNLNYLNNSNNVEQMTAFNYELLDLFNNSQLSSTPPSNENYLPSTPTSLKDGQTYDNNFSPNSQEERKKSTRPLTGRHVRQGTGASPTTLATLKLMIKERQKNVPTKKTNKRKTK